MQHKILEKVNTLPTHEEQLRTLECALCSLVVTEVRSMANQMRQGTSQLFDEISMVRRALAYISDGGPSTPRSTSRSAVQASPAIPTGDVQSTDRLTSPEQSPRFEPVDLASSNPTTSPHESLPQPANTSPNTPAQKGVMPSPYKPTRRSCPPSCRCTCHKPSLSPIPRWFSPWLGNLHLPRAFLKAISSFSTQLCDDPSCKRGRENLMTIQYFVPTWFMQTEASIRCEAIPLHFCIQTPRVVEDLSFLGNVSLDGFKMMLSTGRATLNDVEPNGYSVLHV